MSKDYLTLLEQADLLFQQNKFFQAKELLESCLQPSQACYEGYLLLSQCLFELGEYHSAIAEGQKAERFDPLQKEFQSVQLSMQNRDFVKAENTASLMLKQISGHPRAIFTLAHTSLHRGLITKSLAYLRLGVKRSPANILLRKMLITNLETCGCYEEMLSEAKILVNLVTTGENRLNLIRLLLKYARYQEALEQCDEAKAELVGENGLLSEVELMRSHALRILGNSDGCIFSLQSSLKLKIENPRTWVAMADLKTYKFNDREVASLGKLIQSSTLKQDQKSLMLFALAKTYEQREDHQRAFQTYEQANALHSKFIQYRIKNTETDFSIRKEVFNSDSLKIKAPFDSERKSPIFIVGLPRSGSTLLEQMLASHSCITSTLEQPTVNALERRANELCVNRFNKGLFGSVGALTSNDLYMLGKNYYEIVSVFSNLKTKFFIDKLPFNFRQIGLIHKILPEAIIIDVRRNPLDCGLSLFKQYFPAGVDFSYQQNHIGHFYNHYVDLMRHWENVLPNKIICIQYEELVVEPEIQLQKIFSSIGLNFELSCLDFYKNKQLVHTASSEQVRQPLNQHGIGRWRKVNEQLTLLKNSIEPSILIEQQKYLQL